MNFSGREGEGKSCLVLQYPDKVHKHYRHSSLATTVKVKFYTGSHIIVCMIFLIAKFNLVIGFAVM